MKRHCKIGNTHDVSNYLANYTLQKVLFLITDACHAKGKKTFATQERSAPGGSVLWSQT